MDQNLEQITNVPSRRARDMKRDINSVEEKHIIALLENRTELDNAVEQINIDLIHLGYKHPYDPKRMTEQQFLERFKKEGFDMYNTSGVQETYKRLEFLEVENSALVETINMMRKTSTVHVKPSKKKSSKKK